MPADDRILRIVGSSCIESSASREKTADKATVHSVVPSWHLRLCLISGDFIAEFCAFGGLRLCANQIRQNRQFAALLNMYP